MEFDGIFSSDLTRSEKMEARNLMAENPEIFEVPEECFDCADLNKESLEIAEEVIECGTDLAVAARALCYFKEQCDRAVRDADGNWVACGSRTTPLG